MTAALTLTALLCLFGLPLYGRFYISAKIQHPETAKTLPYLYLHPSFMLFSLILHWEQSKPRMLSSAYGTIPCKKTAIPKALNASPCRLLRALLKEASDMRVRKGM